MKRVLCIAVVLVALTSASTAVADDGAGPFGVTVTAGPGAGSGRVGVLVPAGRATRADGGTSVPRPSCALRIGICSSPPRTAWTGAGSSCSCPGIGTAVRRTGCGTSSGDGQVVGILGGHEEGGTTPDVSYSVVLGAQAGRLYREAAGDP
ncbi:hypothetical protein GCM10010256_37360 [Streptomyces coeruleorubidus]|nr:hypothetical protein GCM10010256_37360 [Streptomyces coeruleorubidus]